MKIEIGMVCKQIKVIEDYGFDYVGEEFTITKSTETVVMGKGVDIGVGFGIETEKFSEYFEFKKEEQEYFEEFFVDKDGIQVSREGRMTVVLLPDGFSGASNCLPNDKYVASVGLDIAHTKAKIKSLKSHLDEISK